MKRLLVPADPTTPAFAKRFWSNVRRSRGCWLWKPSLRTGGYGRVLLERDGRRVHAKAHRVAWELAHGPIPAGLFVCHHCDNPPCVRPDHLFLGTPKDNAYDAQLKGRCVRPTTGPRPRRLIPIVFMPDGKAYHLRRSICPGSLRPGRKPAPESLERAS